MVDEVGSPLEAEAEELHRIVQAQQNPFAHRGHDLLPSQIDQVCLDRLHLLHDGWTDLIELVEGSISQSINQ